MKQIVTALLLLFCANTLLAKVELFDLKCKYLSNPERIDMQHSHFFWKMKSDEKGQGQTAYQLLVATSQENLDKNIGDVFDSKKVKRASSIQIMYQGQALEPASSYFWKVRGWDVRKAISEWRKPVYFSTDLFSKEDWKSAQWIAWCNQEEWATEW
ncbi:glycoside hydrolase family 78 protein [Algibacter pacificus]|uniref:glycoside hydrolase family 78 protein n=1 Tax=Algibacter pacificus TaxID=2599389 RepID=UPI0011CC3F62|nr:hypothetical protein [Algibacter pacificus]